MSDNGHINGDEKMDTDEKAIKLSDDDEVIAEV